jgi:hypothetical protein
MSYRTYCIQTQIEFPTDSFQIWTLFVHIEIYDILIHTLLWHILERNVSITTGLVSSMLCDKARMSKGHIQYGAVIKVEKL